MLYSIRPVGLNSLSNGIDTLRMPLDRGIILNLGRTQPIETQPSISKGLMRARIGRSDLHGALSQRKRFLSKMSIGQAICRSNKHLGSIGGKMQSLCPIP